LSNITFGLTAKYRISSGKYARTTSVGYLYLIGYTTSEKNCTTCHT